MLALHKLGQIVRWSPPSTYNFGMPPTKWRPELLLADKLDQRTGPSPRNQRQLSTARTSVRRRTGSASAAASWSIAWREWPLTTASQYGQAAAMPPASG